MTKLLYSFKDWLFWLWRAAFIVIVATVIVFVVATLCVWAYDVVVNPPLAQNTTQIFGVPRNPSDWLVVAVWLGFLAALATFGAGVAGVIALACCLLLVQAFKARAIAHTPLEILIRKSRVSAPSEE